MDSSARRERIPAIASAISGDVPVIVAAADTFVATLSGPAFNDGPAIIGARVGRVHDRDAHG